MYKYGSIWGGTGILLSKGAGGERTSVGIGKKHLSYAIRYLENRITGFHSLAGRLDMSRSSKGVTLTDYQGRRLYVPNKDTPSALDALYRANLSVRNPRKPIAARTFSGKMYKLYKGCNICGYNKCADALDFHHTNNDKEDKEKEVGQLVGRGKLKEMVEEIKKCEVLCANCHRELHSKIREK